MFEGKKAKILVVEDHEYLQQVYRVVLEEEGFIVVTADDEEEALRWLDNGRPDLVLLAFHLQGPGTGLDILRAIRRSACPEIPVILTAAALTIDDIVCIQQNSPRFDAYVPRSFDSSYLLHTINHLLKELK